MLLSSIVKLSEDLLMFTSIDRQCICLDLLIATMIDRQLYLSEDLSFTRLTVNLSEDLLIY